MGNTAARLIAMYRAMRKHFGPWERRDFEYEIPAEPPQTGEKRIEAEWPSPTLPYLYMGTEGRGRAIIQR